MIEIGGVITPDWRVLLPEKLDDSLVVSDRTPFPEDKKANPFKKSAEAGLMGIDIDDLERAERQYPHLEHAIMYLDRKKRNLVGELGRNNRFGTNPAFEGLALVAITSAYYKTWASMGLSRPGETFIEPGGEFRGEGGSIRNLGVFSIETLQNEYPSIPIVRRPTRG